MNPLQEYLDRQAECDSKLDHKDSKSIKDDNQKAPELTELNTSTNVPGELN